MSDSRVSLPINPALKSLPVYQPGRPIEEVARELGLDPAGIIKLASNENPLGPSPVALAAMREALDQLHRYPDGSAFHLKRKLAEKHGIEPGNIILGNGSNEILEFVGHAFLQPGVDVIVSQYCFVVYPIVTRLFGATLITIPAVKLGHDLQAMLKAITPNTRIVFVANPNNPTGTSIARGELSRFVAEVPSHVLVALDEAYIDFMNEPADFLPAIRRGDQPNLLLFRTFSKLFGLAGLRLGYGIGHADLIAALEKVRQPFNINSLVQAGAMAALDDVSHQARTLENNRIGLEFFRRAFEEMRIEYVPSAANFILIRVEEGQPVFDNLQREGVIVRPMGGYGLPEYIRISIGTAAENSKCLLALKKVLSKRNAKK